MSILVQENFSWAIVSKREKELKRKRKEKRSSPVPNAPLLQAAASHPPATRGEVEEAMGLACRLCWALAIEIRLTCHF
jgi:hypothetical protein